MIVNNVNDILELLNKRMITKRQAIERVKNEFGGVAYAKNASKIEKIAYANSIIDYAEWKKEMKAKNQSIPVLWYYGETGSGKTRKAKEECEKRGINYYLAGGSRPFDGAVGLSANEQEALIIDDLHPNVVHYIDLLQIFDPSSYDVVVPVHHHKLFLMPKIIIVTSPYSPEKFYFASATDDTDDDKHLNRCITQVLKFTKEKIETITSELKTESTICRRVYSTVYSEPNPFYENVEQRHHDVLTTPDEPFDNIFGMTESKAEK